MFQRFFETISKFLPARLDGDLEALSRLDPNKIYLENVRNVLGVSTPTAERICETAVRQGAFKKAIEVVCPDGSIAASAESESNLPAMVRCWDEVDGEYQERLVPTAQLKKTVFYRLSNV